MYVRPLSGGFDSSLASPGLGGGVGGARASPPGWSAEVGEDRSMRPGMNVLAVSQHSAILPSPNKMKASDTMDEIARLIVNASGELSRISHEVRSPTFLADPQLYNNPETKFEEYKACKLLTEWLAERGWAVEVGVYELPTAFKAVYEVAPGGRTVCYNAEYGEWRTRVALKQTPCLQDTPAATISSPCPPLRRRSRWRPSWGAAASPAG